MCARTYQLNAIWQQQIPHTTIIDVLRRTHTHVMMHYHFGFAFVRWLVRCSLSHNVTHIAYLLICRLLSSNRSTINSSFAPFFHAPRLIYTQHSHLYAKSFEYQIGLIIELATYIKLSCFANRWCWTFVTAKYTDERRNCWILLCQDFLSR